MKKKHKGEIYLKIENFKSKKKPVTVQVES